MRTGLLPSLDQSLVTNFYQSSLIRYFDIVHELLLHKRSKVIEPNNFRKFVFAPFFAESQELCNFSKIFLFDFNRNRSEGKFYSSLVFSYKRSIQESFC